MDCLSLDPLDVLWDDRDGLRDKPVDVDADPVRHRWC